MVLYTLIVELERMALEGKREVIIPCLCRRLGVVDRVSLGKLLMNKVFEGVIDVGYCVICPQGHIDVRVKNLELIASKERRCSICGIMYTPNAEDIDIVYKIREGFIEDVSEKYWGDL